MCDLHQVSFQLPSWIDGFLFSRDKKIPNVFDRMSLVIELSRRNVIEESGGPFGAAIFEIETGQIVSVGVNLVTTQGLSLLHAEMVAFSIAQRKLGTYDLGASGQPGHELVTSTEPCAMCYGAIPWSGVRRVVTGARDADARSIGFDEGPKVENWKEQLQLRGIDVISDVQREKAASVLSEYLARSGLIYNARQTN